MVSSTPIGIRLESNNSSIGIKKQHNNERTVYKVGKLISKGAFGAVHVVVDGNHQETEWAVKLTPIPTKVTKKQTSAIETAHRLLWVENLLYSQHFATSCGTLLPNIPRQLQTDGLELFIDNASGTFAALKNRICGRVVNLPLTQNCLYRNEMSINY
jgi:hypothetical protein